MAHELVRFKEDREGPGKEMAAVSGVGVAGVVACAQPVGSPGAWAPHPGVVRSE